MNIKQKIITGVLVAAVTLGLVATPAFAADTQKCGSTNTSIIGGDICKNVTDGGSGKSSGIWAILLLALNIMTAGVGVLAVGGIVYGAIMYASAGDKADQTKKAISIITNVVIGLIAYGLMFLVLNFLIPGAIFSTTGVIVR